MKEEQKNIINTLTKPKDRRRIIIEIATADPTFAMALSSHGKRNLRRCLHCDYLFVFRKRAGDGFLLECDREAKRTNEARCSSLDFIQRPVPQEFDCLQFPHKDKRNITICQQCLSFTMFAGVKRYKEGCAAFCDKTSLWRYSWEHFLRMAIPLGCTMILEQELIRNDTVRREKGPASSEYQQCR